MHGGSADESHPVWGSAHVVPSQGVQGAGFAGLDGAVCRGASEGALGAGTFGADAHIVLMSTPGLSLR